MPPAVMSIEFTNVDEQNKTDPSSAGFILSAPEQLYSGNILTFSEYGEMIIGRSGV